jgi:orotate phosphoribosyltransferase
VQFDLLNLVTARKGHFLLESGHHGDTWLDLELLCLKPELLRPIAAELANRLRAFHVDVICGPLVEGAFVGLLVASELGAQFSYTERFARQTSQQLFRSGYQLPDVLRSVVRNKRVAIVNDVINAGSAVRGTFEDLQRCSADVVAIGALLVLGTAAGEFAASKDVALETVAAVPNTLWDPPTCPLCASDIPLLDIAGFNADPPDSKWRSPATDDPPDSN